ncbi:MAG: sigma-70 family RNA polymerase sigma factor [Oscillospiraceae bacterium]|nr:sigma-70 family RNA polymerase sigma factor [Oscillospiraceae bacterium]
MTDSEILDLYFARSESAIEETSKKYGSYCSTIAMNILQNREDSEECVNDALLNAWNSIPPRKPQVFSSFLGRITRNISLDRYKSRNAKKRGEGNIDALLSELELCVPSNFNVDTVADGNELTRIINKFLESTDEESAAYFLCRYWYGYSVPMIAEKFGAGQSKVKMSLHRTRKKLKTELEKRGVTV